MIRRRKSAAEAEQLAEPPLSSSPALPADISFPALPAAYVDKRRQVVRPTLQLIELTQERREIHLAEFREASSTEVLQVLAAFLKETMPEHRPDLPPNATDDSILALVLLSSTHLKYS